MTGRARAGGRPRDARVDAAVLEVAGRMLLEDGFDRMRVDAVAAAAGVAKATVYRRWPSKRGLAIAALAALAPDQPVPATGDLRADLVAHLAGAYSATGTPRLHLLGAVARAGEPAATAALLQRRVLEPERARLAARLATAVAAGEARADVDLLAVVDLLIGTVLVRLARAPLPEEVADNPVTEAESVVDTLLLGIRART